MSGRTDPARDGPLRRCGDALRRDRRARQRLAFRSTLTGAGCAALVLSWALPPIPRLLWNASASAPIGLYWVTPGSDMDVGEMVIAWPPQSARWLAADRHYLPLGVPLVKRVAAGPGDQICASGSQIAIDGKFVALRRSTDARGRSMPSWSGCRWLRNRQYLLLMADVPTSFDGRYFGHSESSDILGRARLLWRR